MVIVPDIVVAHFQERILLCSAAFAYAGAGFDVWLVNNRGTRYGREHSALNHEEHHYDFYEFTIVELGAIDLAEQIDYILSETGHKKVILGPHRLFAMSRGLEALLSYHQLILR